MDLGKTIKCEEIPVPSKPDRSRAYKNAKKQFKRKAYGDNNLTELVKDIVELGKQ